MLKKRLAKLIRCRQKNRPVGRKSRGLRASKFEKLEQRQLLAANIATGLGTNQYVEELAAEFGGMVVDINKDGHIDLVGDSVHIGSQNGSWQTYANGPGVGELADIDGDNDLDVVSGKHWYENLGGGTSWTQHQIASITANDETVADFDGDGHLDVLISANDKVSWYENVNGDGSQWTEHAILGNGPFDFKAAVAYDVDGDGDQDFFLSYDQWYLVWMENPGNGNFSSSRQHEVGLINDGPTVVERNLQLEVGDFDKDGRPDVFAIGKAYRSQLVWFQPNTNIKSEFRKTTIGRVDLPDAPKTVDLDNDGNLELIVGTRDDDRIFHYQRDTSGSFTRSILTEDYLGAVIDSADLDGDGDVDLVGADFIFWNSGGDFHIDTTDVSPNVIASGDTGAVFKIDATHNGQTGDPGLRLDGLSFLLDDGSGDVGSVPLDSSGVSSRFASWKVYADDGDGAFGTSDTLLLNLTDFTSVANGVLQAGLTNSPSFARLLSPGLTRSYWLEVEMAASGHESGNFRITHLTDQGRLAGQSAEARRWSSTIVANDDYSPNVTASFESAGNISVSLNTVTTNAGIVPPGGITDLMRIEATHAGLAAGELATLAFRFDDNGRPMTSAEVNSLIESLWIVDGTFGSHLVRLEDLSLNSNGVLHVTLPDGSSSLNLFNETKSYIVVIQTTSDSIDQAVRDLRMTHLTDEANGSDRSTVELASNDAPATLLSTPDHSVVVIAGTPVDIAVTSSVSTPIVSGQQVTYTLNVSNQHARTDATGVTLKDVIPDVLQSVTLTDIQLSGGAISSRSVGESLSGEWMDLLTLPHGTSVTYTLTGTLLASDAGHRSANQAFLFTDASVELPYELVDSDLSNNAAIGAGIIRAASTGTGEFNDSGINLGDLNGTGAERINGVAVGDIDGDGDMDAIVTRGSAGSPDYSSVLINDGLGNYTDSGQDLGLSNSTAAILGDLDGDGDLDLYLATSTGSTTSNDNDRVYFNDGHGNFTASQQSFAYASNVAMMGDIDRDGDLDILIAGASQSATLLNNGSGVFTAVNNNGLNNLQVGHLADMDGDGDLDVVGKQNHLYVYSNDGTGSFSRGANLGNWVQDFDLGDIDNDGDVDILATWGSFLSFGDERWMNSIRLLRNNGTGAFTSENLGGTSSYQEIELGDFDGDGDLDAFTVEDRYANVINGEVYDEDALVPAAIFGLLWTNDGSGGFADSGQTLDYDLSPTQESAFKDFSLTAADVNGDGSLDIVTGDFGAAKVWFNNVAPTLTVTDLTVVVEQDVVAVNSGLVSDSGYDSVTLTASVGTVTDNGDGTWSWSLAETSALGTSTVVVSATDMSGETTEVTFELVVGLAPVISVNSVSVNVAEGQTATNSGTFGDPDSSIAPTLTASVGTVSDNGDGTWSWSFDTSDGPDQSQTVTITSADAQGLTATSTFTLIVNNQAPTITATDTTVTVNEGATAFMSGTITDAGLDTVSLAASSGTVNDNGDGTWSWAFDTNDGPDDSQTVTISATDSDGAVAETSFELIVNNAGPVLNFDASSLLLYEGQTASKSGTVADVDGVASLTASQGTVVLNADGTWNWTDIASTSFEAPPQQVVLTATDQDGAVTQRSFTLTVINVPVIFNFDSSDMTVNEGERATRTGTYDNPRNEPLSFWSNVGQFTDNGDGTFSWSWLASDGPATQDVLYTLGDDDSASGGFFQVTVNNVAPTISADDAVVEVYEGQTAANSGSFGDVGLDTASLAASVGTVTDNGDGTWSWSFLTSDGPDESQSVTITATDSDGAASTVSFQLTVIDLPVLVNVPENSQAVVSLGTVVANAVDFRMFGEAPAGELGPGQSLNRGESITSPDGMARLVMQGDGNLVVYISGKATWASGTNPASDTTTTIEPGGNLVIRNGLGNVIYQSGSGGHTGAFARLRVDNTGVPQIVRVDGEILWQGTLNRFAGQGTVFSPDPMRPEFVLGADTELFEIVGGDQLQFIASPDFENPTDADSDGIYEVSVLADDGSGNVLPKTFLVTVTDVAEIPAVESIVINNGEAQRSMVLSLTVSFDSQVTIDTGAFSLVNSTTGDAFTIADADVSVSVVNGQSIAVLTFNNSTTGIIGGSLADGRYTLTINASKIHVGVDSLATNYTDEFFRFFGDSDGDGDVDAVDYLAFRRTYRRTSSDVFFNDAFDQDGDGDVDAADYLGFRRNYRRRLG